MQKAFSASRIFTGDEWLDNGVIVLEEGTITAVRRASTGDDSLRVEHFDDHLIVPAFIDAQVYGAGGKLFSAYPSADTLSLMQESFQQQGTVLFAPTVATNTPEVFKKCIDAVSAYWK